MGVASHSVGHRRGATHNCLLQPLEVLLGLLMALVQKSAARETRGGTDKEDPSGSPFPTVHFLSATVPYTDYSCSQCNHQKGILKESQEVIL